MTPARGFRVHPHNVPVCCPQNPDRVFAGAELLHSEVHQLQTGDSYNDSSLLTVPGRRVLVILTTSHATCEPDLHSTLFLSEMPIVVHRPLDQATERQAVLQLTEWH